MQNSNETPSLRSLINDLKVLDANPVPDMVVTFYNKYNVFVLEKNIISDSTPIAEKEAVEHVREAFQLLETSKKDHYVKLTVEHVKNMEPTILGKVKDSLKTAANAFMKVLGKEAKFDRNNKVLFQERIKAAREKAKGISI